MDLRRFKTQGSFVRSIDRSVCSLVECKWFPSVSVFEEYISVTRAVVSTSAHTSFFSFPGEESRPVLVSTAFRSFRVLSFFIVCRRRSPHLPFFTPSTCDRDAFLSLSCVQVPSFFPGRRTCDHPSPRGQACCVWLAQVRTCGCSHHLHRRMRPLGWDGGSLPPWFDRKGGRFPFLLGVWGWIRAWGGTNPLLHHTYRNRNERERLKGEMGKIEPFEPVAVGDRWERWGGGEPGAIERNPVRSFHPIVPRIERKKNGDRKGDGYDETGIPKDPVLREGTQGRFPSHGNPHPDPTAQGRLQGCRIHKDTFPPFCWSQASTRACRGRRTTTRSRYTWGSRRRDRIRHGRTAWRDDTRDTNRNRSKPKA